MASKKSTKKAEEVKEEITMDPTAETVEIKAVEETTPVVEEKIEKEEVKTGLTDIQPKFKVGDIVFLSKEANTDLNGFKLFPQYKKYTYTVEAYDAKSDVYTLRRLNLSLRLKGELILAPNERAHDAINRKQF